MCSTTLEVYHPGDKSLCLRAQNVINRGVYTVIPGTRYVAGRWWTWLCSWWTPKELLLVCFPPTWWTPSCSVYPSVTRGWRGPANGNNNSTLQTRALELSRLSSYQTKSTDRNRFLLLSVHQSTEQSVQQQSSSENTNWQSTSARIEADTSEETPNGDAGKTWRTHANPTPPLSQGLPPPTFTHNVRIELKGAESPGRSSEAYRSDCCDQDPRSRASIFTSTYRSSRSAHTFLRRAEGDLLRFDHIRLAC